MFFNPKLCSLHIYLMQVIRYQEEMLAIYRQKIIIAGYLCQERVYSPEVRTMSMCNHNCHHVRFNWVSWWNEVFVFISWIKCSGQEFANDNDEEGATCKHPGNAKCNPNSWDKYEGYHDACCSDLEKCGIDEGDCNSDSECLGSLICLYNGCPASQGFDERASCCQQPSATFKMGMR